jgi:glycosyltransferase involved in cell wall biosynthesis
MRIAYVTIADPADRYAWSGMNHTVARWLAKEGADILPIGPLKSVRSLFSKARAAMSRLPGSPSRYLWSLDPGLLQAYARQVEKRLRDLRADMVFSPGTQAIAYLRTDLPVAFWTDAPFVAMRGYYPWYQGVCATSLRDGAACDDHALRLCRLACYSSHWAACSAVEGYSADPKKVHVLPFGANLEQEIDPDTLPAMVVRRLEKPWRFLFVGVEWTRKGGDLALAVVRALNERGCPSELIVAGCKPPKRVGPLPAYVRLEGFISQHTPEGRRRLEDLFSSSLFYLMPSTAEAYGIVFCEASAHGVPSLSTTTGGIPTIVENGYNGQLFALDATADAYVDFILAHTDPAIYLSLALSSLQAYRERLSWSINLPRLKALLEAAAAPAASAAARPSP